MGSPSQIEQTISTATGNPAEVRTETATVRQHRLKDLIEADRYIEQKTASRNKSIGLRLIGTIPPGPV